MTRPIKDSVKTKNIYIKWDLKCKSGIGAFVLKLGFTVLITKNYL